MLIVHFRVACVSHHLKSKMHASHESSIFQLNSFVRNNLQDWFLNVLCYLRDTNVLSSLRYSLFLLHHTYTSRQSTRLVSRIVTMQWVFGPREPLGTRLKLAFVNWRASTEFTNRSKWYVDHNSEYTFLYNFIIKIKLIAMFNFMWHNPLICQPEIDWLMKQGSLTWAIIVVICWQISITMPLCFYIYIHSKYRCINIYLFLSIRTGSPWKEFQVGGVYLMVPPSPCLTRPLWPAPPTIVSARYIIL
jgi:hypothetical protein